VTGSARGEPFVLPRLQSGDAADGEGFFREAGARLGFYEPGERPLIYDPTWTGTRSPAAIAFHEDVHQQLTINTHHGLLTQLLASPSRAGQAPAALRACLEEQWSVQELAATYGELTMVRLTQPAEFDAAVRSLPTSLLRRPPYRELFDVGRKLIPLSDGQDRSEAAARHLVMQGVAACGMQTRCLRDIAETGFIDADVAAYLRRVSPHVRFERIADALASDGMMRLVGGVAELLRSATDDPARDAAINQLVERHVVAGTPGLELEGFGDLRAQGEAALEAMNRAGIGASTEVRERRHGLSPAYVDSPEKRRKIQEQFPYRRIDQAALDQWLRAADVPDTMVYLVLGMPGGDAAPVSAVHVSTSEGVATRDDLRGGLAPHELINALMPFPRVPRCVCFAADAWRAWYQLFGSLPAGSWVHQRFGVAIRICVHRELSEEALHRLLQFEDIGADARAIVFQLSRGLHVGCLLNPGNPGAYCLQKIPSSAALRLFDGLVEQAGIGRVEDPEREVAHLAFLRRLVPREFVDPSDLR
jgi:hypothetical protein